MGLDPIEQRQQAVPERDVVGAPPVAGFQDLGELLRDLVQARLAEPLLGQ